VQAVAAVLDLTWPKSSAVAPYMSSGAAVSAKYTGGGTEHVEPLQSGRSPIATDGAKSPSASCGTDHESDVAEAAGSGLGESRACAPEAHAA